MADPIITGNLALIGSAFTILGEAEETEAEEAARYPAELPVTERLAALWRRDDLGSLLDPKDKMKAIIEASNELTKI